MLLAKVGRVNKINNKLQWNQFNKNNQIHNNFCRVNSTKSYFFQTTTRTFFATNNLNSKLPNINEADYPPKIIELAKDVATLNIFEAVELSECASIRLKLKNPFFSSTAAGTMPVSMSGGPAQGAQAGASAGGDAPAKEEKKDANAPLNVKLVSVEGGVKAKFAIMKLIGTLNPDLSLAEVCFFKKYYYDLN